MKRIHNRVALITGGGSGIGKSTARLFAREGARVVLFGRRRSLLENVASQIGEEGGEALAVQGDMTDEDSVRNAVRVTVQAFHGIDILVNNAGTPGPAVSAQEYTDAMWDEVLRTNVTGTFRMIRAVIPHLTPKRRGSIVNVSSISGLVGMPNMVAYSVTKGAIIALTRSIAVEYGRYGIRCNCICPGTVSTPATEDFLASTERHRSVVNRNVLSRVARPFEIAEGILFLGSDESSFMTGAILTLDGGYTSL